MKKRKMGRIGVWEGEGWWNQGGTTMKYVKAIYAGIIIPSFIIYICNNAYNWNAEDLKKVYMYFDPCIIYNLS